MKRKFDLFICHAKEDKDEYIYPLLEILELYDVSYWIDTLQIRFGQSIIQKINEGIIQSKYLLAFLSRQSIAKKWVVKELNAMISREISNNLKILPILIGKEDDRNFILNKYPLINERKYLVWDDGIEKIINEILGLLGKQKVELADVVGQKKNYEAQKKTAHRMLCFLSGFRLMYGSMDEACQYGVIDTMEFLRIKTISLRENHDVNSPVFVILKNMETCMIHFLEMVCVDCKKNINCDNNCLARKNKDDDGCKNAIKTFRQEISKPIKQLKYIFQIEHPKELDHLMRL